MYIAKDQISGEIIALCDRTCSTCFIGSWPHRWTPEHHKVASTEEVLHFVMCIHCSVCGRLLFRPDECWAHEGHCPPWRWEFSTSALAFVANYLNGTPEDRVPDHVLDMARSIALLRPEMTPAELAKRLLGH